MNNKMGIVLAVVVIAVIGWFAWNSMSPKGQMEKTEETVVPSESTGGAAIEEKKEVGAMVEGEVKEIKVKGSPFKFEPSTITVNKGEKVKIVFENVKGTHDWKLDEFNAKTNVMNEGETDIVEFTADKTGTFEYYCSVGNHRAMGMKGSFIVK